MNTHAEPGANQRDLTGINFNFLKLDTKAAFRYLEAF
jgi:hypothetical protein